LPNPPQIKTIYPAGPLPAKCPRGMLRLQSYGSCNAWKNELTLDVIAAHLIAPYAKIIISATPADTEITGDPAENVAMPEIMKGVAYISSHHLADVMSISDGTGETTYPAGPAQVTSQNAAEPGDATYMIDPSLLKLSPGQHTVSMSGMLLTETAAFTSS
jgi:subtilase family serine protease